MDSVSLQSFSDELEKISMTEEIMQGLAIGQALGQIPHVPVGGKSMMERVYEGRVKDKKLSKEEREYWEVHRNRARINKEMAAGAVAGAPMPLIGMRAASAIGKRIDPVVIEESVELAGKLSKELSPKIKVVDIPNWKSAVMIPEGGSLPKFLRPLEENMYRKKGLPMEEVKKALDKGGAVFAPTKTPSILAHELGHASLRSTKGKALAWKMGRAGVPLVGSLAAAVMLASDDPKDWKVKAAPAVAAIGTAPLFLDEALASRRGLAALKKVAPELSPETVKRMSGTLKKALGTYGAFVTGAVIAPVAAMALSRQMWEKPKGSSIK